MSGPHSVKLDELRRQRGLIDQAITALEYLNGDRAMPEQGAAYTAVVVEPKAPQRLLPPAKRKYTRRKKTVVKDTKLTTPAPAVPSVSDNDAVLKAVKALGGEATRDQVVKHTKLPVERVSRAKERLVAAGKLEVKGWARASRWSLPGAKEEP